MRTYAMLRDAVLELSETISLLTALRDYEHGRSDLILDETIGRLRYTQSDLILAVARAEQAEKERDAAVEQVRIVNGERERLACLLEQTET